MSTAHLSSLFLVGLQARLVTVETDCQRGQPNFFIVGLADKSIEEAKERVRSALNNCGQKMPWQRITINLAPADFKKFGTGYDLAIALSILMATNQIKIDPQELEATIFLGELGLEGSLRPIPGVLPMLISRDKWLFKKVFLPHENAVEASFIKGIEVYAADNLKQILDHLQHIHRLLPVPPREFCQTKMENTDDNFAMIQGQESAKRALIIAASGGHNILLIGSPGSGKTMLAHSLPALLPPLNLEESLEVTQLYSLSGLLKRDQGLLVRRPWRAPYHTSSPVSIIGGGRYPLPGEISLAHHGVLFLDEFPEFSKSLLENLRQPLEDRVVTVARVSGSVEYPANFILAAAMNPCPCGFSLEPQGCNCLPAQIKRYRQRISGPILDRLDLFAQVPRVKSEDLVAGPCLVKDDLKTIKQQIFLARQRQQERFKNSKIYVNSQMDNSLIQKYCELGEENKDFLEQAVATFNLSARGYYRVLKVARTIADLEGADKIGLAHLSEAVQYRQPGQWF